MNPCHLRRAERLTKYVRTKCAESDKEKPLMAEKSTLHDWTSNDPQHNAPGHSVADK